MIRFVFATGRRRGGGLALAALAALVAPSARGADEPPAAGLYGESRAASLRLAAANKRCEERKWSEALDELQAILDGHGNELAAVDSRRSVQVRLAVHTAIARMPPEVLKVYRGRVEAQASRWLEQGVKTRDVRLLRKVVDEAFCSRSAEKALDLLGDLAFERGQFDDALAWWRLLAPSEKDSGDLIYPDLHLEAARLLAKQLLAQLFRDGPGSSWEEAVRAYAKTHAATTGRLAGRHGSYAQILEAVAQEAREGPAADPDWSAYGGDTRHGLVAQAPADILDRLSALCREGPTWRFRLDTGTPVAAEAPPEKPQSISALARSFAFHPIITPTHVFVADARRVTACNLRSGAVVRDWYELPQDVAPSLRPNLQLPAPPDLRYMLTACNDTVYVRLGVQGIRPPALPGGDQRIQRLSNAIDSFLASLRLSGNGAEPRLRWLVRPSLQGAVFEGSPVADSGLVWIASTRFVEQRAITSIECYAEGSGQPTLRWRRDVCQARAQPAGNALIGRGDSDTARYLHPLLTRAGSLLVYCSHSGAIVAVDPASGNTVWGVRYPQETGESDEDTLELVPTVRAGGGWHDLNPCLYAEGRIYAAPSDSNRLLCLDPATGQTLWERERLKVVHLLGVGHGKLIFTTATGLRAVGAADGGDATGWSFPDEGQLPPMGRGLLLGDLVLWPTAAPRSGLEPEFLVCAVRQADGHLAADPGRIPRLPAGNFAYAHGCLAVANQDTLSVFVPAALRAEEKENEGKGLLDGPVTRRMVRRLLAEGRAQMEAGRLGQALQTLAQAEAAANHLAGEMGRLREEIQRLRQTTLLTAARKSIREGQWAQADTLLADVARVDFSPPLRLNGLVETADLWERSGRPEKARACWEKVLATAELRSVPVVDHAGLPGLAGEGASAALRRLSGQERFLGQISKFAEQALAHEKAKRPGAAAHAWRQVLACASDDSKKMEALAGLARCLEQQGCLSAARECWERLARQFGEQTLAEVSGDPIKDAVAQRLRGPPYTRAPQSGPKFPLRRVWHLSLSKGQKVLSGSNSGGASPRFPPGSNSGGASPRFPPGPDSAVAGLVFVAGEGVELSAVSASSGTVLWHFPLAFAPAWAGCHADLVIVGGPNGITCRCKEDGQRVWDFPAPPVPSFPASPPHSFRPILDASQPETLDGFQLAGGRLFFFQGRRRLFALNVETGRVLWLCHAPGAELRLTLPQGEFVSHYYAGPNTLCVQTSLGCRRLLDATNGHSIHEFPISHELWQTAPNVLSNGLLLLTERNRRVLAVDEGSGREIWSHDISGKTILSGEPAQAIASGASLLIAIPTNLGCRVERLDPATGKLLWEKLILLPLSQSWASTWVVDDKSFYLVRQPGDTPPDDAAPPQLECRSLKDGNLRWERPLCGASCWAIRRVRDGLVCYPFLRDEVQIRFPMPWGTLQWVRDVGLEKWSRFPVVCCDLDTGMTVQTLNFAISPRLSWIHECHFSLTANLNYTTCPPVRPIPQGFLVALSSDAWGLAMD
jgi:outer membrane protein assembly factor BamB/tetratricopeptide (TPR) repeat protein